MLGTEYLTLHSALAGHHSYLLSRKTWLQGRYLPDSFYPLQFHILPQHSGAHSTQVAPSQWSKEWVYQSQDNPVMENPDLKLPSSTQLRLSPNCITVWGYSTQSSLFPPSYSTGATQWSLSFMDISPHGYVPKTHITILSCWILHRVSELTPNMVLNTNLSGIKMLHKSTGV